MFVNSRGAQAKIRPTSRVETVKLKRQKKKGRTEKVASRDASQFMRRDNRMADGSKVKLIMLYQLLKL